MEKLKTGYLNHSYHDEFPVDQGVRVNGDTRIVGVEHHPFTCPSTEVDQVLGELSPPDELVREFNKYLWENPWADWPEAWEEVDFEERYKEHLRSDKTNDALFKLDFLMDKGEVCLVCSCGSATKNYCIRRLIYEHIKES